MRGRTTHSTIAQGRFYEEHVRPSSQGEHPRSPDGAIRTHENQTYRKDRRHYVTRRFCKLMRHDRRRAGNYAFEPGLYTQADTWLAIATRPVEPKQANPALSSVCYDG